MRLAEAAGAAGLILSTGSPEFNALVKDKDFSEFKIPLLFIDIATTQKLLSIIGLFDQINKID